ncbi:RusA family crossover junction endodeoxyribonuclease [Novosphingobium barchaimii]|nr:endodeoxyribonuclease RusA [Novosphingobium barchaimii]
MASSRIKRNARQEAALLARAALGPTIKAIGAALAEAGSIEMTVTFYPPDRRHRDDDNMIASFKAARDGIADALGVDDRKFRPKYTIAEPCTPGRIEITL